MKELSQEIRDLEINEDLHLHTDTDTALSNTPEIGEINTEDISPYQLWTQGITPRQIWTEGMSPCQIWSQHKTMQRKPERKKIIPYLVCCNVK